MQTKLELQYVEPIRTAAPYIGGKKELAERLASIMEQIPHGIYAEPFIGMGGVFFKRRLIPGFEVINDINGELINLFRILQRHYPQFMETLKFQITSRKEFERLCKTDPSTLTDLERAARFLYLQRNAFGGKVTGQNFGITYDGSARFNISTLGPILEDIHERLSRVTIECLGWKAFIERYDRPETLFYLDPPYFGNETDYGKSVFSPDDFLEMANLLKSIKGRFILSLNDKPEVREIFSEFHIHTVELNYYLSGKPKPVSEVIIMDKRQPQARNLP